jgi:hypothetical protein
MQRLSDATGETVHLGMLIDSEIIYVHKVDSRHMLGMYSRVGPRAPLHCTAIGKVLMAWEEPGRRATSSRAATSSATATRPSPRAKAFEAELERTLAQGMRENRLRTLWKNDQAAVNGWLAVPNSFSAEVMAHQGWDTLTIDLQHGVIDYAQMVTMLQAISTTPRCPSCACPGWSRAS